MKVRWVIQFLLLFTLHHIRFDCKPLCFFINLSKVLWSCSITSMSIGLDGSFTINKSRDLSIPFQSILKLGTRIKWESGRIFMLQVQCWLSHLPKDSFNYPLTCNLFEPYEERCLTSMVSCTKQMAICEETAFKRHEKRFKIGE